MKKAYNTYINKSFGQKFVEYLRPKTNTLPIDIKKNIHCNQRNLKKFNHNKIIVNWLFTLSE